MKKLSVFLYTLALGSAFYSCSTAKQDTPQTDYTQYVDPFIGAADNGHTFPGACRPFGMIQTSPVTGAVGWRYCSNTCMPTPLSGVHTNSSEWNRMYGFGRYPRNAFHW